MSFRKGKGFMINMKIPSAKETLQNTPMEGYNYEVESVLKSIKKASEAGKRHTCFCPSYRYGDYYDSVKQAFLERGYRFSPTGVIGGVMQDSEEICW